MLTVKILFLSISVRALSTIFRVQDVMPVTSARLADISWRAFVNIWQELARISAFATIPGMSVLS